MDKANNDTHLNYRLIDANFNRAREAMRLIEDCCRFILNDTALSTRAKSLRHTLSTTIAQLDQAILLDARNIVGDVGTTITLDTEQTRTDINHVVTAAFKRAPEALRVIEEALKCVAPQLATHLEKCRYVVYELEKQVTLKLLRNNITDNKKLYVLVTGCLCKGELLETTEAALAGGADYIQLREKGDPAAGGIADGELLTLAKQVSDLCHKYGSLFIMNDRADIAKLANAHGVHVGQDDLAVNDVRTIIGGQGIVGKSAHDVSEAQGIIAEGVDYVAIGAVYASNTKSEVTPIGLDMVKKVRAITDLPIVAIGGITQANVADVMQAGASAVAICQGVIAQDNPEKAAKALIEAMHE